MVIVNICSHLLQENPDRGTRKIKINPFEFHAELRIRILRTPWIRVLEKSAGNGTGIQILDLTYF